MRLDGDATPLTHEIKKLEICGFKSFVDRTVLHFDHDVTCGVGPNGCGKSNVWTQSAGRWASSPPRPCAVAAWTT